MRVAFIGMGAMGLPMAGRVAAVEGIDLVACDLNPARLAMAGEFARTTDSVSVAIADADVIFSVVPADAHVLAVAEQIGAHGRPGQVYVDFSTIGPETVDRVARDLAMAGITVVSMALTRSTAAAQAGELVLFGGGMDDELSALLEPALSAMSVEVRACETLGGAKALKLANNMVVAGIDVAVCEAIVLGGAFGLSATEVVAAIGAHGASSWALTNHIETYVLPDDLGPGRFSTNYMAKDVSLFSTMALGQGGPGVLAALVSAQYRGTVAMGFGNHYHMIVRRWQELAGRRYGRLGEVLEPTADLPRTLAHSIAGTHIVLSEDALAATTATGVARREGAAHLIAGSAGNAYLEALLADDPRGIPDVETTRHGLDTAIALSEQAHLPSILLAATRALLDPTRPRADP